MATFKCFFIAVGNRDIPNNYDPNLPFGFNRDINTGDINYNDPIYNATMTDVTNALGSNHRIIRSNGYNGGTLSAQSIGDGKTLDMSLGEHDDVNTLYIKAENDDARDILPTFTPDAMSTTENIVRWDTFMKILTWISDNQAEVMSSPQDPITFVSKGAELLTKLHDGNNNTAFAEGDFNGFIIATKHIKYKVIYHTNLKYFLILMN